MRPSCVRSGRSRSADRERPNTSYLVRAEGVGFEPTVTLPPQWFSRAYVIQCSRALRPGLSVATPTGPPMIIPDISRAVYAAASGSSSGQSWTLRRAASRISCPSMPTRVSPIPYTGHWQMNSSGPAGGSGHTHH